MMLASRRIVGATFARRSSGSTSAAIDVLLQRCLNDDVVGSSSLVISQQQYNKNTSNKIIMIGSNRRCYSSTIPLLKKKKKKDDDDDTLGKIISINADDMSQEEMQKTIQDEYEMMLAEERDKFLVQPEDWKPGMRKRKLVSGINLEEFQYEMEPEKFGGPRWTLRDKRCGLLAIKVGMVPIWDDKWGQRIPCTVLFVDNNIVLGHKTMEQNGYWAVQIAAGERKRKNVRRSVLGQYKPILQYDKDQNPPYLVREFRVTDPNHLPPLYSQLHARHFVPGQNVDISGISKGKGFQGGMKRHGFGGLPASHGTSKSHRSIGSTGNCQDPGKVFKGKKMPGRMGTDRVTVQNLRIVKIDRGRNLLYVKGAIPGNKGGFVEIRDAVKKPLWNTDMVLDKLDRPPLPTFDYTLTDGLLAKDGDADKKEDEEPSMEISDTLIDGTGQPGYEIFMPLGEEDPLDPDYRDTVHQLPVDPS